MDAATDYGSVCIMVAVSAFEMFSSTRDREKRYDNLMEIAPFAYAIAAVGCLSSPFFVFLFFLLLQAHWKILCVQAHTQP